MEADVIVEKTQDPNKLFKKENIDLVLFINDTKEPKRWKWMKQKYPNIIDLKFSPFGENNLYTEGKKAAREKVSKELKSIRKNPINIRLCVTTHGGKTFELEKKKENLEYIENLLNFISKNTEKEDQIINFELKYYTCTGNDHIKRDDFEKIFKNNPDLRKKINFNVKVTQTNSIQNAEYKNFILENPHTYSKKIPPASRVKIFKNNVTPIEYRMSEDNIENFLKTGANRHYIDQSSLNIEGNNLYKNIETFQSKIDCKINYKNIVINKIPKNLENKNRYGLSKESPF